MKQDGWIKEVIGVWILRFKYHWQELVSKPKGLDRNGKTSFKWSSTLKKSKENQKESDDKIMEKVIVNWMETYCPSM